MVINNFDIFRTGSGPTEANPELPIDSNAMLTLPVTIQRLSEIKYKLRSLRVTTHSLKRFVVGPILWHGPSWDRSGSASQRPACIGRVSVPKEAVNRTDEASYNSNIVFFYTNMKKESLLRRCFIMQASRRFVGPLRSQVALME